MPISCRFPCEKFSLYIILERYEKFLRVSSSVKTKSLPTSSSGREWTSWRTNIGGGPNETRDKDSPSNKCQQPSRRANEWVEGRATSCPQNGKLSLKVDESQLGQWHEDFERKRKSTTLLFSLKGLEILHQERREQVNINSDGTLQHHSLPQVWNLISRAFPSRNFQ